MLIREVPLLHLVVIVHFTVAVLPLHDDTFHLNSQDQALPLDCVYLEVLNEPDVAILIYSPFF